MHIATKGSKLDISAESDTAKLAKEFSKFLKKGDVVYFYGEIGVGKTTFIRYLINNFQKSNNLKLTEVPSPTFSLVNEYELKNFTIQHYDLFRLKHKDEIKNIGLLEDSREFLTLIEWPDIIDDKPQNRIDLYFNYNENLNKRFLSIIFEH